MKINLRNKNTTRIALCLIALVSFLSVIYTTLTYGRVVINSDVSLVSRFYDAMRSTGSIYPNSWNAVNGEIYAFTRLPVNVLMLAVIKDRALAIVISNCLIFTVSLLGVVWLTKRFFGTDAWLVFVPFFSVFLCGNEARGMIFLHGAYCGFIIIFTFVFGLFWTGVIDNKSSKVVIVLHSVILFLMILGGKRHVAEYLLPTIATLIIYLLFINRSRNDKLLVIRNSALKLLIPAILGYLLYILVCSSHNMNFGDNSNPSLSGGLQHIVGNIGVIFINLFTLFGYSEERRLIINVVAISVSLLACVIFPVLQAIEFKKLNEKEKIYFVFTIMHNAELLIVILLGNMLQPRYLLSSVFLLLIVSANYFYKKLMVLNNIWIQNITVIIFLLVTAYFCRDVLKLTYGWQDKYYAEKDLAQQLVDNGITKGYSSFWLGYPNEVYSNGELTFGGVDIADASFMKQYSNCDNSCYEYKDGKCCLILSAEEYETLVGLHGMSFMNTFVGEPIDVLAFSSPYYKDLYKTGGLVVYIFENDICDRLSDGLKDGVLTPREMTFNMVGTWSEDKIEIAKDGILHGPYKKIAPGKYQVKYFGENLDKGEVDIMSEASPDSIEYTIVSQKKDEIEIELFVDKYVDDVQFYLTNNSKEVISFNRIKIKNIS